jgi:uncharacterized protein (DUF1501 family)
MLRMTPSADQTMAALLEDLHQRGLLKTTLVVMATEFGRTPQINEATAGRGHHPGVFTWWFAGDGMKGGTLTGVPTRLENTCRKNLLQCRIAMRRLHRRFGLT